MRKFVLFFLILIMPSFCWGKDLLSVNQHWTWVQLLANTQETDPLFSDTGNIREGIIKDAYAWMEGVTDGRHYLDRLTLQVTTTVYQYNLEPSGFVNEILPVDIKAVRRLNTANPPALSSISLSNFNNRFSLTADYPTIYAYDRSHIYFNSYPAATCTIYVWAYREADAESCTVSPGVTQAGIRKPVLSSMFRPLLWLKATALAREKETNEIAEHNLSAIAQALFMDFQQVYQMTESKKDIRVLPEVY